MATIFPKSTSTGADVNLDTTNFNQNLSPSDTTTQLAMETLDELNVGDVFGYNALTNTPDLDVAPTGINKNDLAYVTAEGLFYDTLVHVGDTLRATVDNPPSKAGWIITEAHSETFPAIKIHPDINTATKLKDALQNNIDNPDAQIHIMQISGSFTFGGADIPSGILRTPFSIVPDKPTGAIPFKISWDNGAVIGMGTEAEIIGVDLTNAGASNATFNFADGDSGGIIFRNCDISVSGGDRAMVLGDADGNVYVKLDECTGTNASTTQALFATSQNVLSTEFSRMELDIANASRLTGLVASTANVKEDMIVTISDSLISDNGSGVWNDQGSVMKVNYSPASEVSQALFLASPTPTFTKLWAIPGIEAVRVHENITTGTLLKTALQEVIDNPRDQIHRIEITASFEFNGGHNPSGVIEAPFEIISGETFSGARYLLTWGNGAQISINSRASVIGVNMFASGLATNSIFQFPDNRSGQCLFKDLDFSGSDGRYVESSNDGSVTLTVDNCTGTNTHATRAFFKAGQNPGSSESTRLSILISNGSDLTGIITEQSNAKEVIEVTVSGSIIKDNGNGCWKSSATSFLTVNYTPSSKVNQTEVGGATDGVFNLIYKIPGSQVDIPQVTGLIDGGQLSVNADTTKFDISALVGLVVNNYTDALNPVSTDVNKLTTTAISVTNLATQPRTFITIDKDGNIIQRATSPDALQIRDEIYLGAIVHTNNVSIEITIAQPILRVDNLLASVDFMRAIGIINEEGNVISPNGANLNLNRSAGVQFRLGANQDTDPKNPNRVQSLLDTALTLRYRYQDGIGGFTQDGDVVVIQPDIYDDGSGTPASVTNNKFTIQKAWVFSGGQVRIQYGQNIYDSMADAEASLFGEAFSSDPNLLENAAFRSWIIVKKGVTDLTSITEAKFIEADKFGLTTIGGVSSSTTNLQGAYNNSVEPEILTDATRGAVTLKRGSPLDTDNVFEVLDGLNVQKFAVTGDGKIVTPFDIDLATPDFIRIHASQDLKAIVEAGNSGDAFLLLPGIHNISASITFPASDMVLQGIGDSSIVNWTGADGATMFTTLQDRTTFKLFKMTNDPAINITGINVFNGEDSVIEGCSSEVVGIGILITSSERVKITRNTLRTGRAGISLAGGAFDPVASFNSLIDCGGNALDITSGNSSRCSVTNNEIIFTRATGDLTKWTRIKIRVTDSSLFLPGDIITQAVTGATGELVDNNTSSNDLYLLRTSAVDFDLVNIITGAIAGSDTPLTNDTSSSGIKVSGNISSQINGVDAGFNTVSNNKIVIGDVGIAINASGSGINLVSNQVLCEDDGIRLSGNFINCNSNHIYRTGTSGRGIHLFVSDNCQCIGNTIVSKATGNAEPAIECEGEQCTINDNKLHSIFVVDGTLTSGVGPAVNQLVTGSKGGRARVREAVSGGGTFTLLLSGVEGIINNGDTLRSASGAFFGVITSLPVVTSKIQIEKKDNIVSGNFIDSSTANNADAMLIFGTGGHTISNNTIMGSDNRGIQINSGSDIKILNNTIKYQSEEGIRIETGLKRVSVQGNTISDNSLASIGSLAGTIVLAGCDFLAYQSNKTFSNRQTLTVASGIGYLVAEGVTQGNAEGVITAIATNDITIQWFDSTEIVTGTNLVGVISATASNVTTIVQVGTHINDLSVVDSSCLTVNENQFSNSKNQSLVLDGIANSNVNDNHFSNAGLESIEFLNSCDKLGLDSNIMGVNVSGDNLSISNGSTDIKLDDNILEGSVSLGTSGSLFPRGNIGIQNIVNWTPISPSNFTATPASTSQITMSNTSDFIETMAVRYRTSAGTFYAEVDTITVDTSITIKGAPLVVLEDILELNWGVDVRDELHLNVLGNWASAVEANLIANTGFPSIWNGGTAYLVSFNASQHVVDSGTEGKFNLEVNNLAVSTNDTNNGIQLSTVDAVVENPAISINKTNYEISKGNSIEGSCTVAGGNTDGEDLTIVAVIIKKGI